MASAFVSGLLTILKFLIVCVHTLMYSVSSMKYACSVVVLVICLMIHVFYMPYYHSIDNTAMIFTYLLLIFWGIVSIILVFINEYEDVTEYAHTSPLLLIGSNSPYILLAGLSCLIVMFIYVRYGRKYIRRLLK